MADFGLAWAALHDKEGSKVSNDPTDPGGPSRFGVSLRSLKGWGLEGDFNHDGVVDARDISVMTEPEGRGVARRHWWDPLALYSISDQQVANKVLDITYNFGVTGGATLLQRALVAIGRAVMVDGVIGAQTLSAVNAVDAGTLLNEIRLLSKYKYEEIAADNPVEGDENLRGWIRRALA